MVDQVTRRRIGYWGLFALIWLVVLFVRFLPLDAGAGRWPGPDWVVLIAFAWVLRRPNFVPVLLVALIFLLDDFLFMRPPGLWAALSIVGLEFLRGRSQFSRDLPFLFEWVLVAGVILAMMLANRLILAILVVAQPDIALNAIYYVGSVAAYPIVVFVSSLVLGVRRAAPGEVDEMGHPI